MAALFEKIRLKTKDLKKKSDIVDKKPKNVSHGGD